MNNKNTARLKLILIIAIFIGPLIAAFVWYQGLDTGFRPESTSNHGKLLLPVTPLEEFSGVGLDGKSVTLKAIKGRWTMLFPLREPCSEQCRKELYNMHQVRLALGRDMGRMQRMLMLNSDYMDEQQKKEILLDKGLITLQYQPDGLFRQLSPKITEHQLPAYSVFLIDPNGNLVMSFPPDLDPRMVLKDLKKLLKLSNIG